MGTRGADYAFYPHPSIAGLKAAGVEFVVRYISSDPANDSNGKNLLPGECGALLAAGIRVCVVSEEGGGQRLLAGNSGGVADAKHANAVVAGLKMPSIPVYFAADWDAAPGQQALINAYLDGAASVIGHARTGIYGGYWPLSRALTAGACAWGWQTLAWSGGLWDSRAVMRQGLGISVGGVQADVDTEVKGHDALVDDYGQWPRPGPPPPPVPITAPTLMQADGRQSLRVAVHAHATTVQRALWLMANNKPAGSFGWLQRPYVEAGDWNAPMPQGMTYWVG